MYRVTKVDYPSIFTYFFVIIVFLSLSGCAGYTRIVLEENRILLSDELVKEGTFTDGTNTLNYQYTLDGNNLALKGEVFARGSVSWLKVRLLLLNDEGGIVESRNIYTSAYRNYRHGSNAFTQNVLLTDEISAFTFDFYVEYRTRR